jgi:predicted nucleic acid-binding protein
VYYLDTSALAKLVVREVETEALRGLLAATDPNDLVTSALTRAELLRAAYRYDNEALRKAREVLDGIAEITITKSLLDAAGTIGPSSLRTLDAIHLVSALELGGDLAALVAYDERLLDAAVHVGVPTLTPT